MKIVAALVLMMVSSAFQSDRTAEDVVLNTEMGEIHGSLLIPESTSESSLPIVLIISGSGPTDRNGNQPMMMNNSLKMLAEGLYDNDIASLRFDKRGVGASVTSLSSEADLRFDDYVDDVVSWINYLKKDSRFGPIIIAGHSEGSLIGMLAAHRGGADMFVSIAGIAESADKVIAWQLASQPDFVKDAAQPILDELVAGRKVDNVPPMLAALFRPSVQPYIISWFQYKPQEEIARLEIPVLIVQGRNDIQVQTEQAVLLSNAISSSQTSKLVIIDGMNHILKPSEADIQRNIATYSQPELPLSESLIPQIVEFINNARN
ncbi:MAG: alpha/beta hydrolase [Balneolales bacterium]|nr:alpha/beta hydrolase [Balneolales bacterium]